MYVCGAGAQMMLLYVNGAQGRPGGFQSLSKSDGEDLLATDVTFATRFKTERKFGLQPIALYHQTDRNMMSTFLERIRPSITKGVEGAQDGSAPLFVKHGKIACVDISGTIARWSSRYLKTRITTNDLRAAVTTKTFELAAQGVLTPRQVAAVHAVNGHSNKTAEEYYQYNDRLADMDEAGRVANIMRLSNPSMRTGAVDRRDDVMDHTPRDDDDDHDDGFADNGVMHTPEPRQVLPITTAHRMVMTSRRALVIEVAEEYPCIHAYRDVIGDKFPWSSDELEHLAEISDRLLAQDPGTRKLIVSLCRREILASPLVLQHFHPQHLATSDRLRNGYEHLKRLRLQGTKEAAAV